jgi:hypothetical protein
LTQGISRGDVGASLHYARDYFIAIKPGNQFKTVSNTEFLKYRGQVMAYGDFSDAKPFADFPVRATLTYDHRDLYFTAG